jgi:fructose-bisphosphate aldolase class II
MIDGSKHSFEDNIKITKQVVDYAHSKGVVVEGELGKLAGIEDNINVSDKDAAFTDRDRYRNLSKRQVLILWQLL